MKVDKTPKRLVVPPADLAALIDRILTSTTNEDLTSLLTEHPVWIYPRGDLSSWIAVLNKFDTILEEIINSSDLDGPQITAFDDKSKATLLAVLGFTRLLLENCTNRKLFASYDRLNQLLHTSDLDILHSTLYVLVRPLQQYTDAPPFGPEIYEQLASKFLSLSRGWEKLALHGWDLFALASATSDITIPDDVSSLSLHFYPTAPLQESPSKPQNLGANFETPIKVRNTPGNVATPGQKPVVSDGSVNLELGNVLETLGSGYREKLSALATEQHLPTSDYFAISNKVRVVLTVNDKEQRSKLLAIRLLALASYTFMSVEETALSTVFLYEPTLITQVADLLRPSPDIPWSIRSSALYCLDGCLRHQSKTGEVLTALSANVNHGIFVSYFRSIVERLVAGEHVPPDIIDGIMSILAFLAAAKQYWQFLIGSGVVPLLLQMLECKGEQATLYVPRSAGLIDTLVLTNPQAMSAFTAADGINILVARVKAEIQAHLERILPPATDLLAKATIIAHFTSPLKMLLRSIQRLMHNAGGTDGLRNLVDSDLPKSIKRIFEDPDVFGPRVFAIAINVIASFVHNEPTSLSILQELQIPRVLYTQLEKEIPPYEVLYTVTSVVGAFCLNTPGLAYTVEHKKVIENVIDCVTMETPDEASTDRDNIHHIGLSLDELVRHHPTLRPIVLDGTMALLRRTVENAKGWVPPLESAFEYGHGESPAELPKEQPTNRHLKNLTSVYKYLQGLLRNSTFHKDFMEGGGFDLLSNSFDLNCMPVRFSMTPAYTAISTLFRTMGEHEIFTFLDVQVKAIKKQSSLIDGLIEPESPRALWLRLQTDDPLEPTFSTLKGLTIRMSLFAESLFAHGQGPISNKTAASILKALGANDGFEFLQTLGRLHKVCFKEQAILERQMPSLSRPIPTPRGDDAPICDEHVSPRLGCLKYLASRLNMRLTKVFKNVARTMNLKRTPDAVQAGEVVSLADALGEFIVQYLQVEPDNEEFVSINNAGVIINSMILFDGEGPDSSLNTILFTAFEKKGGLVDLIATIRRIMQHMGEISTTLEADRDEAQKTDYKKTTSGLTAAFTLLRNLVGPSALLNSPYTHAMQTRRNSTFIPTDLLIKIRHAIYPVVWDMWTSPWLTSCTVEVVRPVIKTLLALDQGKDDENASAIVTIPAVTPIAIPRPQIVADPAAVTQLVDMGFPRRAAEAALVRARNSVAAAADMILSMPHLFNSIPEPVTPPAPVPDPLVTPVAAAQPTPETVEPTPSVEPTANVEATPDAPRGAPPVDAAAQAVMDAFIATINQAVAPAPVEPSEPTAEPMEVDTEGPDYRKELEHLREKYRPEITARAIEILDTFENLVFDLLKAFPEGQAGIDFILERLEQVTERNFDVEKVATVSSRLRLLGVFLRSNPATILDQTTASRAMFIVGNLSLDVTAAKPYTANLLLSIEALLAMSYSITESKLGDEFDVQKSIIAEYDLGPEGSHLEAFCKAIISEQASTKEELLCALRVLVILTRNRPSSETFPTVFTPFQKPDAKVHGCHALLAMLCRHAYDEKASLTYIMRREIRDWFTPAHGKVSDLNHFLSQFRSIALRNPDSFVEAVAAECALVDPTPAQAVYHLRARIQNKDGDDVGKVAESDPFKGEADPGPHKMMEYLITELNTTLAAPADADNKAYIALILSVLTELLGCYERAKKDFMTVIRQKGIAGSLSRGKGTFLSIVNEMVCCVDLQTDLATTNKSPETLRRLAVSAWSTSMVLGLCADIAPTPDLKDISEDLLTVRKTVLDAIAKAIKENSSTKDASKRYGRLWALAQLTGQLLLVRSNTDQQSRQDETGIHIAKLMLEKNFVSLFAGAVGETDLNFPEIRHVLVALLKPLKHLSKISIKWGKIDKKKTDPVEDLNHLDDEETESEGSSDVHMSEEEEEAPDLYRNSALGMLGGDIGDDDSDDEEGDDDEDEEMMEAFEEMDQMDDDDEDTEPSSDDDGDMDETENEWTDEDGEEHDHEEDMQQDAVLGNPDEDGEDWDDAEDEEMFDSEDEEQFDDDGMGYDEDDLDEMEYDEDGYNDVDIDENDQADPSENMLGSWGWQRPRPAQRAARSDPMGDLQARIPRRFRHDAAAMFGTPRAQSSQTLHPLMIDPSAQPNRAQQFAAIGGGGMGNFADFLASIEGLVGGEAARAFETLIQNRRHTGPDGIRLSIAQNEDGGIGLSFGGRMFSIGPRGDPPPPDGTDISSEFVPQPSTSRWKEEASIIPGTSPDLLARVSKHIINRLLPAARAKAEEDAKKQKEAEDQDAADEAAEEAKKAAQPEDTAGIVETSEETPGESEIPGESVETTEDVVMETSTSEPGPSTTTPPEPTPPPADDLARIIISIHGRDVDITDTGIDLDFLQALPDDMRADVVEQHMREQNRLRRPAANAGVPEAASQISPEFLDALPPEIRAEVIMQEAMESARRNQPADAVRALPSNTVPGFTSGRRGFLAGLDPELREVVMMGQTTALVDQLLAAGNPPPQPTNPTTKSTREALQLLDKPGVASLVRLLFFPEPFKKSQLFKVLANLCENSKTRVDLLSLLLSVVQDGSGDLPAVDRSFQQMSIRALATPKATPKTPKGVDTPGPVSINNNLFAHLQSENIPTFIAQRCFEALSFIVAANLRCATYFLEESEQPVGVKKPATKKGKGKEKALPQSKYPIVALIGLLDRPLLLKTPGMMESLTGLLAAITRPLRNVPKKPETSTTLELPPPIAAVTESMETDLPSETPPEASTKSKPLNTTPIPVIPPGVLRLIVNCLTQGECTSRTFGHTLSVMRNLSQISDAKEFSTELRNQSQLLGIAIQDELVDLIQALNDETVDIEPAVLAKFSAPSSSQAQLLRLLKAIDYLHSKHTESDSPPNTPATEEEEVVREIFSSFQFDAMWRNLGVCLTAVEDKGKTDTVAMVLLPLVETLMVVCKYNDRGQRELRSPSAGPTHDSADLFVSFTTTHRKVLNAIVRNNPALMSGSFSLLIRNPKVLDFDNKRNWFFQKLKKKKDGPTNVLHLNVRRRYVFDDSFKALQSRTGEEVKNGKLSVKFTNEDGVDAGGLTREWYSVLAQQIFDPNFAMFEPCAADQQTYQPNKASGVDHLAVFRFVGRIIGKAVYDNRLLDAYFNRAFYKQILGRTVDMRDLESIDPEYHKSLQWMLENDITGVIDQEFTIEDDEFGEKKIVELKTGGSKIPVTEENKEEYVRLVVSYRLDNSIKAQIKAFLDGFYEIVPRHLIAIFEPDQLELLISGITTVDVDELKNATQMSGWKSSDPEIAWFWRALRSFSQEERSRFLMFVTSSSRVPLGGFTQLQGSSGIQPFQIQKLYTKENGSLPQASTCFNLLLLPSYANYEQLRERLHFAVTETSGFGKA